MPSQAQDTGYGGGGSGGRGRNQTSTLRAVTIRQLCKAVANADDDMIKVDGVDLNTVTVVGRITNVMENNMNLDITIHDGTGQLRMTHFINDDSEQALINKKAEWQPGVYIRAFGHVTRGANGAHNMNAYGVRTIQNHDEVTYHYLRCVFEHLHLTKGGAGAPGGMNGAGMGMNAPSAAGGWGGGMQQQQHMGPPTTYAGAAGGGNECQNAVQEYVRSIDDVNGVHVGQIYNYFNGRFNKLQIDNAMKALVDEAHVYTTVDDDHFKAA